MLKTGLFACMMLSCVANAYENCSTWNGLPDAIATIDLDFIDPARMQEGIGMSSGDLLRFSVRGNPTTGYEWDVVDA